MRRRILEICKQSYYNQLEMGVINRAAAQYLRSLSDACMNQEQCHLKEWSLIERMMKASGTISERQVEQVHAKRKRKRSLGKGKLGGGLGLAYKHASFNHRGCRQSRADGHNMTRKSVLQMSMVSMAHIFDTPQGIQWRSLSLREKAGYVLATGAWSAFVCALSAACVVLTHTTGAASLAELDGESGVAIGAPQYVAISFGASRAPSSPAR